MATATATTTQASRSPAPVTATTNQGPSFIPRGPVTTSLTFYKPPTDGSLPYYYVEAPPEGILRQNFSEEHHSVTINDIRGHDADFSLDVDAFQTVSNVLSAEKDFSDDEHIKSTYYPEVEKLIFDHVPGARKVVIFDHTIRRSLPNAHRTPVTRVHVDQTTRSAELRVRLHSPDEADSLLQGRYRIINVWRPINGPVQEHPLGFASNSTVNDDVDLVPVQHRYPDRTGETASVRYNPDQRFYYWSGMTNDERLLLKCFDSQAGVGQRAPHTAFVDPRSPDGARHRESIEVRALVYG